MPRKNGDGRRDVQGEIKTRLKYVRLQMGVSLARLAELTGISRSQLWRLENGLLRNPQVGYLANCAIVLGADVRELLEDDWTGWVEFKRGVGPPANASDEWRTGHFDRAALAAYEAAQPRLSEDVLDWDGRWRRFDYVRSLEALEEVERLEEELEHRRRRLAKKLRALEELERQTATDSR